MTGPTDTQRAVLADALRLVREQEARAEAEGTPLTPDALERPFALGYLFGVVDALVQTRGAAFDARALAVYALVLDSALGRDAADVRERALDLHEASDTTFARGHRWGGNETLGWSQGRHTPVGLVHVARGDEERMR